MICLGIDFGEKNIGLAISDKKQIVATPLGTIHRKNDEKLIEELEKIVKERNVDIIVIGIPIPHSSVHIKHYNRVMSFVKKVKVAIKIKVDTYDESFSTVESKKMSSKKRNDIEAAIMLQKFIDNC